jgi:hypothetical protein
VRSIRAQASRHPRGIPRQEVSSWEIMSPLSSLLLHSSAPGAPIFIALLIFRSFHSCSIVNNSYSQEFPKRFQKDVVKAACTVSSTTAPPLLLLNTSTPAVSAEGIEHVLRNIGMGNRMSRSEIEAILSEVGACPVGSSSRRSSSSSSSCVISADQMLSLLSTTNWEEDAAGNNPRSMKHASA